MEGFSYNNIFDTKGIEYLVIIAFLVALIPFWIVLNKQVKITRQIHRILGNLTSGILKIPQGLFYSQNHTWAHLQVSGVAKIGLDDLLLHLTGDVKFISLRNPGERINKGDIIAEIEQKDKKLKIFSPISGEIVRANNMIRENAELMNEDPYGDGWIYKIKPTNWIAETNSYHLAKDATEWSNKELERFKDFIAKYSDESAKVIMQDGGELCDNTLSQLPKEIWHDFQNEFLTQPH